MTELTIFNNRIPFGLLKAEHPEIAAKLLEWTGGLEAWDANTLTWKLLHPVPYGLNNYLLPDLVYRAVKPAPTPFWVDEARLPSQVRWVAEDIDAAIWGFERKPLEASVTWTSLTGLAVRLDIFPGMTRPSTGVPWNASLREVKRGEGK